MTNKNIKRVWLINNNLFGFAPIFAMQMQESWSKGDKVAYNNCVWSLASKDNTDNYVYYTSEFEARIVYNKLLTKLLHENAAILSVLDREYFE